MPNVNDIVAVAESLGKKSIAVVRDCCAAVRHRRSSCRRCIDVCPADAIEVGGNEIAVNANACIACGACAVVCPTEALVSVNPTDAGLSAALATAMEATDGRAVFACARISSKRAADPEKYVEVPCLPRIGEAEMLDLAARGAREVLLVDGNCETCKHRACSSLVDETARRANSLLAAHGSALVVTRQTGFPDDLLVESASGLFGTTRRGFFSEAVESAKETAMTAAKVTVAQELGIDSAEPDIGERLRVGENGTLPQIRTIRHETAINALDALGGPVVDEIETRLFGSVTVDVQKCNSCGMCVMFCPTGALSRDVPEKPGDPLRRLEFSACECVQCGLCVDVCMKDALELSARVKTTELFDFEPVTFVPR